MTEFGYGDEPRTGFVTPLATGISYLLLSPGKGLFLFAPECCWGWPGCYSWDGATPWRRGRPSCSSWPSCSTSDAGGPGTATGPGARASLVVTVPLLMLGVGGRCRAPGPACRPC